MCFWGVVNRDKAENENWRSCERSRAFLGVQGIEPGTNQNEGVRPDIFQSLISRSPRARLTSKSLQNSFHAKEN